MIGKSVKHERASRRGASRQSSDRKPRMEVEVGFMAKGGGWNGREELDARYRATANATTDLW